VEAAGEERPVTLSLWPALVVKVDIFKVKVVCACVLSLD